MSNATPSPSEDRDTRLYVEDMLEFCEDVLEYTQGFDRYALAADRMRLDATLRKMTLIGEAATRVPPEVRALAPDVPWRKIVGTRNRLMHTYLGIDMATVWSIVSRELPDLRHSLKELLNRI
jgi:uncharacterized protein with HEPN domain